VSVLEARIIFGAFEESWLLQQKKAGKKFLKLFRKKPGRFSKLSEKFS
jgi:hypothetical protein